MEKPVVFNIQKFSIHDGDGCRTTFFFKGCPLRCAWCHNPESQRYVPELVFYEDRCSKCTACVRACPSQAIVMEEERPQIERSKCTACGICTDYCLSSAREIAGKQYAVKELIKEAMKDRIFYEQSGGGVTLSGGEVMVQNMDFVTALVKGLYDEGVRVNIDTCGEAPYEHFLRILPYTDCFLYDIKLMDREAHRQWVGVDNNRILDNLEHLARDGAKLWIRIPLIDGVNADTAFAREVITFLQEKQIPVWKLSLLPYHDYGAGKYEHLQRVYEGERMRVPSQETLEEIKALFVQAGYTQITIGG